MTRFFLSLTFVVAAAACGGSDKKATEEPAPAPSGEQKACVPGGCSSTVCAEEGEQVMTTCEWKDEYACYKTATCERQADGACGWTQTDTLAACLASPPAGG